MQRVMIIGQPGSGKLTLARELGEITHLPVVHIDHIHWKSGWVARLGPEKDRICTELHARERWIFEGGHSRTWAERLDRADTLIWLDIPLRIRAWRVFWRTVRHWGRTRPDLPEGCPEHFSLEFVQWIWNTRHSAKAAIRELVDAAPPEKSNYRLASAKDVAAFLKGLRHAAKLGHLGISHR